MISAGQIVLYNSYGGEEAEKALKFTPIEVHKQMMNEDFPAWKKYFELVVTGENTEGIDCVMPTLIYKLKWEGHRLIPQYLLWLTKYNKELKSELVISFSQTSALLGIKQ